jgi:hypothetical protein
MRPDQAVSAARVAYEHAERFYVLKRLSIFVTFPGDWLVYGLFGSSCDLSDRPFEQAFDGRVGVDHLLAPRPCLSP